MDNRDIIVMLIIGILPWTIVMINFTVRKQKSMRNLRILQDKYSFTPTENSSKYNSISGRYRNKCVRLEYSELSEEKKLYTKLSVECDNPDGLEFSIAPRNKPISQDRLNGNDIVIDKDFDEVYIVQTNRPDTLKGMLDFNARNKLEQAGNLGFNGEIKLEGNVLTYLEPGLMKNEHEVMKLELILHELCDMADAMKNHELHETSNY